MGGVGGWVGGYLEKAPFFQKKVLHHPIGEVTGALSSREFQHAAVGLAPRGPAGDLEEHGVVDVQAVWRGGWVGGLVLWLSNEVLDFVGGWVGGGGDMGLAPRGPAGDLEEHGVVDMETRGVGGWVDG